MKDALIEESRVEVPQQDTWKIPYMNKLLGSRLKAHYDGNTEEVELLDMLICSLVS